MAKAPKKAPSVVAGTRPPRPTKAETEAERYPNLDRRPALKRALILFREMRQGKSREEAEEVADRKAGPRAPKWLAKHPPKRSKQAPRDKRGKRPEPEKRMRVKAAAGRARPKR
jgi:hypothetical protein